MGARPPFARRARAVLAILALVTAVAVPAVPVGAATPTYRNPLPIAGPGGVPVESCADPSVAWDAATSSWWMACTTDPLHGADRDANGDFIFHLVPLFRSANLVDWTYVGDAFAERPGWVADDAGMWAPELIRASGQWYLYYAASWTDLPGGGSAIGVATAATPAGPWTDAGAPAVEPHAPGCCPNDRRWVFDPDVVEAGGQRYLYYGSYFGGLSVRTLSADGLQTDPATQQEVAIPNRYEGAEVVKRGDFYYLFASATDCCRGPLTGYSVFVGRSTSPTGPFVDRHGQSFLAGRVGGTPVLTMNGNRWVGTGHNTVFQDFAGQTWTIYHAVDQNDPYFTDAVGFTKRPALLDPIDWVGGWPVVRNGAFASDTPQARPAAQPGQKSGYKPPKAPADRTGSLIWSDEFTGTSLSPDWTWVREPASDTFRVANDLFSFDTQAADLFVDSNNASVATRPAPGGPFVVEAKVRVNLPAEGCCFNFVQGGLVLYGGDDNYLKLTKVSIWETRQTEFAKELAPVPSGYPRYGNTVVGPPAEWTWLRIAVRPRSDAPDEFRAWTSPDGVTWDRGGTWLHELGPSAKVGLVSMGGSGFTTDFEHIRVYRLR